jgi:Ras-related protein Rab-7A
VGKTSLLNSYVDQKFVNSYKATVGADFMEKEVVVDGKAINLEVLLG